MKEFTVEHLINDTYVVYEFNFSAEEEAEVLCDSFQGSLADCEAWIKLKQNENVSF